MLPSDFPPWQSGYGYFRHWRDKAPGSAFTATCASGCDSETSAPSRPAWPSSIRSRCRLGASPTGPEALTVVSGSKAASATCWWTAWACS
ncbi:MAG: hypothetical protein BRC53_09610, partial [Cyanobacteria bacterium SW_6_48_11]